MFTNLPITFQKPIMFGILVDVSGSMQTAFSGTSSKSAQAIAQIKPTNTLLAMIKNIVQRAAAEYGRQQQDSVFVGAIGLGLGTCDLISVLESHCLQAELKDPQIDGHQALVDLAKENGVEHIEPWISKLHLSCFEEQVLYDALRSDRSKLQELVSLVPSPQETAAAGAVSDIIGRYDNLATSNANTR